MLRRGTTISSAPAPNAINHTSLGRRRPQGVGFPEWAASLSLIALYSYVVNFLFDHGFPELQPNYFYAAVYLSAVYVYVTNSRSKQAISNVAIPLAIWVVLLVLMTLQILFFDIGPSGANLFVGRIHFFLTMISFAVILTGCARFDVVILTLACVVVAGCLINLAEFLYAGSSFDWMSTVPGRAAGLYENSNDSAMFICFAVPIVGLNASGRLRVLLYAITFLGVSLTFSRGGLLSWIIFVAATELILTHQSRGWPRALLLGFVAATVLMLIISLFSSDLGKTVTDVLWPYLDANTSTRLETIEGASTDERIYIINRGLQAFSEAPLFGQGIGSTYAWDVGFSVHNMIILMLAEMGLVGGAWFVLFVTSLWKYGRPYGVLAALTLVTTGMFTHNHFERPAVAAILIFYLVAQTRFRKSGVANVSLRSAR